MKRIFISSLLIFLVLLTLCSCGKKDVLYGTWKQVESEDSYCSFKFDGKGEVTYSANGFESLGTYEINGEKLTLKIDDWAEKSVEYSFEISEEKLNLQTEKSYNPKGEFIKQ